MKTYESHYFHLRIDFPDTWTLTSWQHVKIGRTWRSAYQTSDDDLPEKRPDATKFLFTAALHPPDSQALVHADVEVSVFRLAPDDDMRTSLVENLERLSEHYHRSGISASLTGEGVWTIGGVDFTYVDQELKSGTTNWYRFYFRPLHENLWLYGKIAGHQRRAYYEEALAIAAGMTFTGGCID